MRFRFWPILIWLGVASAGQLHADTHYVSKTGSNTFPYTSWATAADTVARAVEAADEWDTILIAPGHYVSDTIVMKKGQVLMGAGMDSTVLDTLPLNPLRSIVAEDSTTVSDLTLLGIPLLTGEAGSDIDPISLALISSTGIRIMNDRCMIIRRVRFENLTTGLGASFTNQSGTGRTCNVDSCEFVRFQTAVYGLIGIFEISNCTFVWDRHANVGVIQADGSELEVRNCRFYGYDPLTRDNFADAISTALSEPIVVRNNLFYSVMRGAALELNWEDGSTDSMQVGLVENNTIVGFSKHINITRPGFVFRNNVSIWDRSGVTTIPFYDGYVTGQYNITWDNSPWDSGLIRGADTIPNDLPGNHDNRNVYPMFVDTLDFLLQAFSPAIDAGDPAILDADSSRSDVGYTGGPGGIIYAYLDLAPAVPRGLVATPSDSQIVLSWRGNHESDFDRYELFRDTAPIVAAEPGLLVASIPADSEYTDATVSSGVAYYYRLRAVDAQGNASELSGEISLVATGVGDDPPILPDDFILHPPYPNPFNAQTRINYSLARPGWVRLTVYSVLGRNVCSLVDRAHDAGEYDVGWEANDVGSGVYFVVMEVNVETTGVSTHSVQKALLLR